MIVKFSNEDEWIENGFHDLCGNLFHPLQSKHYKEN